MVISPVIDVSPAIHSTDATWVHYWHNEKNQQWRPIPASDCDCFIAASRPRYVTVLATTYAGDPRQRHEARYRGPLYFDWDVKPEQGGIAEATRAVVRFMDKLTELGVDPDAVHWYASGSKGFHAEIPQATFATDALEETNERLLPTIYREMAIALLTDGMDMSVYSGGLGRMWRVPNVRREDGKFKVPLIASEVQAMTPEQYGQLTAGPRTAPPTTTPTLAPQLVRIFTQSAQRVAAQERKRPRAASRSKIQLSSLSSSKQVIEIVKSEALRRIDSLLRDWLPEGAWAGNTYLPRNPKRNDRNPGSFVIWSDGGFRDFACEDECSGGDLVALYAYLNGYGDQMHDAAWKLANDLGLDLDKERAKVATQAVIEKAKSHSSLPETVTVTPGNLFNVTTLLAKDYPPVKWIVEGILPAGTTLFAAAPKSGKSWIAIDIAVSVAAGIPTLGTRKTTRGRVMLLALEDNERRLQTRLKSVMAARGVVPDSLDYATQWQQIGAGGPACIRTWLDSHDDAALIVVDTLAKIKPELRANRDRYEQEYASMSELKALSDGRDVALLVITHTKKGACDDVLEKVSGSNGLTGGVDNTWIMQRARGEPRASLYVTGRDIEEEAHLGLAWDADRCVWTIEGTAAEVLSSAGRRAVIDVLRKQREPRSVQIISAEIGKDRTTTQRLLTGLLDEGLVTRTQAGRSWMYSSA